MVGQKAPEFTLKSLDEKDKEVKLSQFKDKFVVLDFFTTFSKISKKQVAVMEKLYQKYNKNEDKSQQLVVLGITLEKATSEKARAKIQKFITENKTTFPILTEAAKTFKDYKATQLPLMLFINKDGTVVSAYVGAPTYDEAKMDAEITKLLGNTLKK